MEPHVRYAEPLTRVYDDNENEVKRPPITLNKQGKGTGQVIPPGGYKYLEEEPSVTNTQEPYLGSDDSSAFSEDDGHGDCGRGGYHACPDNPANYNMREDEDEDITVIDVINTNQELPRGEDSETESFGSGGRDSFEEDSFGPEVIEETE
jgi:hypothetical protein